jgi:hypothetical protein
LIDNQHRCQFYLIEIKGYWSSVSWYPCQTSFVICVMLVSHCYINKKEYVVYLYVYSCFLTDHHYKTEILLRDILNTILILLFNSRASLVSRTTGHLVPLPSSFRFTNLTLSMIPKPNGSVQLLHSPSSQSLLTVVS